jgi:hypothetical protein
VVPPPRPWRHPVVAVTLVATLLVALIVDESVVVVGLLMVEEPDMALVPQPDCNVKFSGRLVIQPTIVSIDLRKTMLLKLVLLLSSSSGPDHNWYTDPGATDHITGDLDKLTIHEHYLGNDQIHAANGDRYEHHSCLVKLLFPLPIAILSLIMSCMFPPPTKISFMFIDLLLIMIPLLNFIHISS